MYALNGSRWATLVLRPEETTLQTAGGKGYNLYKLRRAGFNVPNWIVIPPAAFWCALSAADRMALRSAATASEAASIASRAIMQNSLRNYIQGETVRIFGRSAQVAVRSSAIDEDGQTNSFAGQLDSILCVGTQPWERRRFAGKGAAAEAAPPGQTSSVTDAIMRVWLSAFSERNLTYRQVRGLNLIPQPPAVLIQRMVNADCAGVAFGAEPVSGNRSVCVVNAVKGLGDALVSGEVNSDVFYIDRTGEIVTSRRAQNNDSGLSPDQACKLAALASKAEILFGAPQDMEWAIAGGTIHVLQARPITTLIEPSSTAPIIWDNSNIGESYQGVTTPLTFSFARKAYEHVYIQFCRMMGVPEARIKANAHVFPNMIGFINGRVYYNLLNWYRLISILPGFKANRGFMEQMMGVSQSLPPDLVAEIAAENKTESTTDRALFVLSAIKSASNLVTMPRQIATFNSRFEAALAEVPEELDALEPAELARIYRKLEQTLLPNWDAPLTNDFFAMIFYGLLKQLCVKWCGDSDGTMQNALLSRMSGIISAVPAVRMQQMAITAAADPALLEALSSDDLDTIMAAVSSNAKFLIQYRSYLKKFGDRCVGELKLESPSLRDNPLPLLHTIRQLACGGTGYLHARETNGTASTFIQVDAASTAEARARNLLGHSPLKLALFNFVLQNARERVRQRENLRFQRTRLFGLVRRIFTAIGARLTQSNLLECTSDIFFLELAEVFGCIDGTGTTADLKSLVAVRKEENARYQMQPAPPDRFQTNGPIAQAMVAVCAAPPTANVTGAQLSGLGCCPGRVVGPVRVLRNPHLAKPLAAGEIVVAERTDPGWILVFPQAAGLLVEHGSLLSHSAIVSRELGLPAIVSIKGLTSWLADGDIVEMDGATGIVRKLERNQ